MRCAYSRNVDYTQLDKLFSEVPEIRDTLNYKPMNWVLRRIRQCVLDLNVGLKNESDEVHNASLSGDLESVASLELV